MCYESNGMMLSLEKFTVEIDLFGGAFLGGVGNQNTKNYV